MSPLLLCALPLSATAAQDREVERRVINGVPADEDGGALTPRSAIEQRRRELLGRPGANR